LFTILDFLFGLIGKVLVWLAKMLAKLLWRMVVIAVCHPRTSATIAITSALVTHLGWEYLAGAAVVLITAASTWRAVHPRSYEAVAGSLLRTWWRRWWGYRRVWVKVCTRCALAIEDGEQVLLPKLRKVTTTPYWDRLTVRGQIGQELRDFRDVSERLRTAFGAQRAAVREIAPGVYGLDFMRRDPLRETVAATPIPKTVDEIDFRRVPVGRDEFGDVFAVSLLGGHTSLAGSTGAGKAGLQWNVWRYLAPAIVAGLVRPVGIDPKGKELRQARSMFAKGDYVGADPEAVVELLARLVEEMNAANEREGAAGERDFEPRPGRPLTLINIDELAPLLRYWPRSIRSKIDDLLGLLLTQGRAAGFIVIGNIQEPTKDTFTIRDLFTRRLGLRLPTESHTDAALIEDAVEYGAACHQISESTPGVFYSLQDGARSVTRARFGYVEDHHIAELVTYLEHHRNVIDLDTRRGFAADGKAA
jgi:DNA segregation ATPase FtsK/SpoIIIE, S-DNA-T family